MPWTPRGGKALSRAASGRVPGPRTTNSCVKGIMLLIIFVIMLMVASFEHSLAAAAHKIGLDKDVEFAAHLAQPVVERAEAFVEQVETAAARDVAYARSHLAQPVLEHAGAFLEAPVEELGRDYQLVADALRVLARPGAEPDALEAKAAELADLEAERAVRAAQAELKAAAAAKAEAEAERYEAERAKRIADAEKRIAAKREAQEAAAAERLAAERARAERAAEEKRVATKRKKQEADLARAKAEIESVAAEAQARADADRKAAVLFRDTVLYAIVTPSIVRAKVNTGNDRQKLVQASLKAWPALRRFNASYQLDSSCVSILQQRHITISTKYYSEERGVGWIHAGKAPEASTKFAAPAARPAPPAKPVATPEEAAAWAARIPKQVRPPPPGEALPQEGVDTQPAKPVAAQP
ncbi:unnamed protein product [Pelagomonas calceolata]|uniref:Uncharacterized protein n=1 Tax=Pelagomonas calceolata TaxID=35677 RepID=A0A8J2S4N5_9STRA|nr:unnamed protein product [Pelagomonas calceolata]